MIDLDVMYNEGEIQNRIKEMAKEIDEVYNGNPIIAICVLRGAVYFAVDLTKSMNTPMELEFVKTESYEGTESTGKINLKLDIKKSLEGEDVLIIEDIIDTGYTLEFLRNHILNKNPKSLRIAVLGDKKERREVEVPVDFVGFDIPNKFVVGYGFDDENMWRNLPFIGSVK